VLNVFSEERQQCPVSPGQGPVLSWGSNGERNFQKKILVPDWENQLWTQLTTGSHIVESVLAHASSLLVGQPMSRFDELSRLRNRPEHCSLSFRVLLDGLDHTNPTYQ